MRKIFLVCTILIQAGVISAQRDVTPNDKKVIAFVADTQAPMWIETVFLHEDNNPEATKKVMTEILRSKPSSLFMLGDVVNMGPSIQAWRHIEIFLRDFKQENIPYYGVLGNHELMKRPAKGEQNFQHYFPDHVRTGYLKIVDSVAVLLMNSNAGSLSREEEKKQFDWYNKTLAGLDGNPAVKFVIVTCHHSPFTNSKLVNPSNFVQENFIPGYLKSKKAGLFLSGHSHRFEYFRYEEKDFLVIGGGGGLNHPTRKGGVHFPDLSGNYKPLFHYLTIDRTKDSILVQSHALKTDFSGFENGLRLSIPLVKGD